MIILNKKKNDNNVGLLDNSSGPQNFSTNDTECYV